MKAKLRSAILGRAFSVPSASHEDGIVKVVTRHDESSVDPKALRSIDVPSIEYLEARSAGREMQKIPDVPPTIASLLPEFIGPQIVRNIDLEPEVHNNTWIKLVGKVRVERKEKNIGTSPQASPFDTFTEGLTTRKSDNGSSRACANQGHATTSIDFDSSIPSVNNLSLTDTTDPFETSKVPKIIAVQLLCNFVASPGALDGTGA
ncbi:hypothetical protein H0H93_005304 [Arthromyces matolae]|nr:hypothetical protein H0H93_005304 [Arthromyces matolae]